MATNGYIGPDKVVDDLLVYAWANGFRDAGDDGKFYPSFAVDKINYDFGKNTFVCKTGTYKWLAIDLFAPMTVNGVEIVDGMDGATLNIEVRVGNTKPPASGSTSSVFTFNTLCGNFDGPGTTETNSVINCASPTEGRFITLQTKSRYN